MALLGASAALAQQAAHASDRVFGRVLDADGNPAPDATVEFLLRDLSSPSLPLEAACRFEAMAVAHVVRSDTRGAFEATLDPSRLWAVHARTASGLESVVHAPLATGQIVTLTVLPTIALEGVVVAPGGDANPVPGARLMLGSATRSTVPRAHATAASGRPMLCLSSGLFWNIATAVADERGRFRIASVRDVPGFLVAFGEPGATQRWFDGSASQEMQVVLEGPRLRGRVTGPDGGLAGAFLAWSNGVHEPRRSGPEGSFEIPKSITDRLLVSAPGLVPAAMNLGDDGFAGQKELRVRLRRERVVTAQIVDGAETPCADVRVIYCIESYESFSFPIPFEARTDAEGRVALGVPRAESRVTAWAFFANRWLRIGSLVPGDESTFGTVDLRTRVRLYGRVVDVDETPASCLPVHITPLAADGEEPIPVARHAVYTDTAGRFEFRGLPPGRYRVAAAGHRSRVTIVDVDAPAQPTDDPVVLRLQPTKTICGTVRFADGKPAPGAQVHLNEPIPELGIVVTCSDHEGRFEVPCTGGRDAYDVFARFATLVGGRVASIASQRRVAPGRADVDLVLNF